MIDKQKVREMLVEAQTQNMQLGSYLNIQMIADELCDYTTIFDREYTKAMVFGDEVLVLCPHDSEFVNFDTDIKKIREFKIISENSIFKKK